MRPFAHTLHGVPAAHTTLPAVVLSRYLFFLTQRPISRSNTRYLRRRIHGLRSLGSLLDDEEDERLAAAVRLVQALEPANVHELSERLQLLLVPFAQAEVPAGYVSAEAQPPATFLRDAERIVLVFGPAIGIGDEIVAFPLPAWVRRAAPDANVTVLTAYEGLWDGVPGVDRLIAYGDHSAVVQAIRGESDAGAADLVVLLDFENPDLYRAVAAEARVARYAEISLGARVLAAVDNDVAWTYRQALPIPYFRNVYDGFDELARRLGATPDAADRVRPHTADGDGELRVFVSPFSSKYDPTPQYWTTLLASLVSAEAGRRVRFVLDPGPNGATRRFARTVARAAGARSRPGVSVEVAAADERVGLSLPGVFAELERAPVVVCADSFAAHAAARAGCTTLVVATPGLEDWRVPSARSYYFSAEDPLADVVAGMRVVLGLHGLAPAAPGAVDHGESLLTDAEAELERAVRNGAAFDELRAAYEGFRRARVELSGWPDGTRALAGDHAYPPPRELNGVPAGYEPDLRRFVQNEWLTWRNTNMRKYLEQRRETTRA